MSVRIAHKGLLRRLRMEADRITIKTLSIHSRIPYMTLHDIISDSNNNRGTLRTWMKIEDYYQSKNKNKTKK